MEKVGGIIQPPPIKRVIPKENKHERVKKEEPGFKYFSCFIL